MSKTNICFDGSVMDESQTLARDTQEAVGRNLSLDRLQDLIIVFDEATLSSEHEELEIDIPRSLYRYDALLTSWVGRTIEVRMTYDGKILDFHIELAVDSVVQESIAVVMKDSVSRRFSFSENPVLNPVDAKQFISFVMSYFRAFVLRISTK